MKEKIIYYFIDFFYLAVAITALIISIYYSSMWLLYIGTPVWLSWSLAVIYILFLNIIFEASIGVIKQGGNIKANIERLRLKDTDIKRYRKYTIKAFSKKTIGVLVLVVWFCLTLYSMVSTVAGQYNQLTQIESTGKIKNVDFYKNQITAIDAQLMIFEKEKITLEEELSLLLERSSSITSTEDKYIYRNTTTKTENRMDELRKKIKNNNNEILLLIKEKATLEKSDFNNNMIDSGSVYNYFSKIVKINPLWIQFILSLFPSIFIDVIAPVSLSLFIYRKRKNE
jgi:hypothetical protein